MALGSDFVVQQLGAGSRRQSGPSGVIQQLPNDPQPRRRVRAPGRPSRYNMSDEEADSTLAWLARQTGGAIETLGKTLDTPGAIARGIIAGKPGSGFSWDSEDRVYGDDLLDQFGLIDDDTNPWVRTIGGLATEVALDPLALLSGPLTAVTKGGKAARAAGLMDRASDAVMAAKGIDALADSSRTGRAAMKWAKKNNLPISESTFQARPLVGPRAARRQTTLDEVVQYVDNAKGTQEARQAVDNYLSKQGMTYAEVADQKLTQDLGVGFMGFDPIIGTNVPGGSAVADVLDRAGQAAMWNPVTRRASQMFDKKVGGQFKAGDQVDAMRHYKAIQEATSEGRRAAARHALKISDIQLDDTSKAMLGADSLLSDQGNDFLTRVMENTYTAADKRIMDRIGKPIYEAVDSWRDNVGKNVSLGQRLGMDAKNYEDFVRGVKYTPRNAAEVVFDDAYAGGIGRSPFTTRDTANNARKKYLETVGGTMDLREISTLPIIDDFSRNPESTVTIEEAGREIVKWFNVKHAEGSPSARFIPIPEEAGEKAFLTKADSEKIAGLMKRLDPRREAGTPIFSEHPLTAQTRNIVTQAQRRGNAEHLYLSLAENAVNTAKGATTGRTLTVHDAMKKVAESTGLLTGKKDGLAKAVEMQMKKAIGDSMGIAPEMVDLTKMSISDEAVNRLLRVQDFYSKPAAQQEIFQFFNTVTSLFKGFVLAWPSRFVRDFYSNVYSVFLETGDTMGTVNGFYTAQKIMAGDIPSAAAALRKIPKYAHVIDDDALRRQFIEDAAADGILASLATDDLSTAGRGGISNTLVPGMKPQTLTGALGELGQNWGKFREFKDAPNLGLAGIKDATETGNPLFRAQESLSNWIDSQARLGGYIALMQSGVTGSEAARRITESLVDYSSLTTMERNYFRNIFPWWAYNSRIGKYVVKNMLENPGGRYAQTIRALNTLQRPDEDTYVPEALRQAFAVRIPNGSKDYQTYLKDIDLPGVDVLSLFSPKPSIGGTMSSTAQNFGQQLNPFLKTGAEFMADTDFFSRRPLNEAITPFDRAMMGMGVTNRPNQFGMTGRFLNLVPGLSRPMNLAGGLLDQRLPLNERLSKQVVNQLTGVKRQDVDEQWMLNDASRALEDRLEGWTRSKTIRSVPKDMIQYMPEDKQGLAELQRILASRYAKSAREKAKAREAQFKSGMTTGPSMNIPGLP